MKPNLQNSQAPPLTAYDWQKRSNSHNVISEYNIFMTPRSLNPKTSDPKQLDTMNKPPPVSPDTSQNVALQNPEYLTFQKPNKKQLNLPIKEILKANSTLEMNLNTNKKSMKIPESLTDKIMHIYNIQNEEKCNWFNSLSYRRPDNQSLDLIKPSPRKLSPRLNCDENNSGCKSITKGSFDLNYVSSTSNKIRKMLMTSPYSNTKMMMNSLKNIKNLSHGNILSEEQRNTPTSTTTTGPFARQAKGFLSNFNFSRKHLLKLAASKNKAPSKATKSNIEKVANERKECKEIIPEESTFKNSISYKSTHNTSKSADKLKDKQIEELFNLFNRARGLLDKYKIREKLWKQEKEELVKEIEHLRGTKKN